MHRTKIVPSLLGAALLGAVPASAELWSWADAAGTVHAVGDRLDVPPAARAQARPIGARSRAVQIYPGRVPDSPVLLGLGGPRHPVRVPIERDGALIKVRLRLNDQVDASFYLDTGASVLVLPRSVAAELGFRPGPDVPRMQVQTLDSTLLLPTMTVASVRIGRAEVSNLTAVVSPTLDTGLLGGSFLTDFSFTIDAESDQLVLTPRDPS